MAVYLRLTLTADMERNKGFAVDPDRTASVYQEAHETPPNPNPNPNPEPLNLNPNPSPSPSPSPSPNPDTNLTPHPNLHPKLHHHTPNSPVYV